MIRSVLFNRRFAVGRVTEEKGCYISGENCLPSLEKDRMALILGTGWSDPDVLKEQGFILEKAVAFVSVGIVVGGGAGHPNQFLFGTWHGHDIVISQGRVHLYQEHPKERSMIREWMYILLRLMGNGNKLFISSSVGGIGVQMKTGYLVKPTMLVSAHLPQPYLNGRDGEFVMSEDLLWEQHKESGIDRMGLRYVFHHAAIAAGWTDGMIVHHATQMVIPGPGYGGRAERRLWKSFECDTVGMSLDPELRLVALENQGRETPIEVLVATIVTDDHDLPNHVEITAQAKKRAPQLGKFLSGVVEGWNNM